MQTADEIVMALCRALDCRDRGLRYGRAMEKIELAALHWRVERRREREETAKDRCTGSDVVSEAA